MVVTDSGEDLTERMRAWAQGAAERIAAAGLDGYVLKKSSPSCGMERVKVYDENGAPARGGRGLFAAALMERLPLLPVEEEGRLRDARLREHFVARIFARARVREFLASDWGPARARRVPRRREDARARARSGARARARPARGGGGAARPSRAGGALRRSSTPARSRSPRRRAATRTCSSTSPGTSRTRCRARTGPSCSVAIEEYRDGHRPARRAAGAAAPPHPGGVGGVGGGAGLSGARSARARAAEPSVGSASDDRRHRRPGRRRQEHRRARRWRGRSASPTWTRARCTGPSVC